MKKSKSASEFHAKQLQNSNQLMIYKNNLKALKRLKMSLTFWLHIPEAKNFAFSEKKRTISSITQMEAPFIGYS